MTEPMKRGALARTTRDTNDLATLNRRYSPGFEFEVEDYVPDGEINGEPAVFYWGNAHGGMNNVCVLAADVEQAKSAEEMAARTLPEPKQLLDFICSAMLGEAEDLKIEGMHMDGREISGFGVTDQGLDFAFAIPVTEVRVWRTDG